jgi:hypothetical protein
MSTARVAAPSTLSAQRFSAIVALGRTCYTPPRWHAALGCATAVVRRRHHLVASPVWRAGLHLEQFRGASTTSSTIAPPVAGDAEAPVADKPTVPRSIALERWGCHRATLVSSLATSLPSLSLVSSAAAAATTTAYGGVEWTLHERMDFYLEWQAPKGWVVAPRVAENFIMVQCAPPPQAPAAASPSPPQAATPPLAEDAARSPPSASPSHSKRASVHGFSITSFAYHQKVAKTDDVALLKSFLAQFSKSVGHSVNIVASSYTKDSVANTVNAAAHARCAEVVRVSGVGAVCEITFKPPRCPVNTRGLCRAFFHSSKRFHYVVTFAVPDEEFDSVADLIVFGTSRVTESGGDAADR